eukprot:746874-Prymnesium_polylepis.1
MRILKEHGLGGVPCGNPDCTGSETGWDTAPTRWSYKTSGSDIVLEPNGLPAPMAVSYTHLRAHETLMNL